MPSGKIHTVTNFLPVIVGTATAVYFFEKTWLFVFVPIGSVICFVVTPDLDLETGSISWAIIRKYFGTVISKLWQYYWYPYAKLTAHRGLSHYIVISTIIRFIYVGWWLFFIPAVWIAIPFILLGMVLSDLLHIILDAVF